MKEIKKILIPPFFISMETATKFVLPIPISLSYLVPLNVDVTENITANICEVWSEFNMFCTLVTMATVNITPDVDVVPIKFHQFLFGE
jgi:hypothetical protein